MDTPAAVSWLLDWHRDGPWLVAEIDPHAPLTSPNPPRAREFTDEVALRHYIEQRNGLVNLYFSPNKTLPGLTTTPHKSQITHTTALFVDLDLPKTGQFAAQTPENLQRLLDRICALAPAPTVTVYTGGGFQAFWVLDTPQPTSTHLDLMEAAGKAVATELRSDAIQNVNRWMRLPGTVNIPNQAKRERGRVDAVASIVDSDWMRTWSLDDPVPSLPAGYFDDDASPPPVYRGFNELPVKWQKLVLSGDPSGYRDDRSALVIALAMSLVAKGWEDEEILPFLIDERYGTSEHCRSKPNPRGTALRQIERARGKVSTSWERTPHGAINASSPKNIRLAIDGMGIKFSHDTFSDRYYVNGVGPTAFLDDPTESRIRVETSDRFGFLPPKDVLRDVTVTLARTASFHPVHEFLSTLRHDGVGRVETWLIDAAAASDTPYTRAVSRLILVAAVRRVRQPGCKFDEMLVFVNPTQGTDKSTAIAVLAVRDEWFTDSFPLHCTEQRAIEQLQGKWLVECAELQGMRQADVEHVKTTMSRTSDRARMAYGHHPVEAPRQCVFFGTTNTTAFLRDRSNRRFWPVVVGRFDVGRLVSMRDQLWAEAASIEASGASIRLDPSLWDAAAVHQEEARYGDPWSDILFDHLSGLSGRVASNDVWRLLGKPEHQRGPVDNGRLTETMAELGWERTVQRIGGVPTRSFVKGDTEAERASVVYVWLDDPSLRTYRASHSPAPDGGADVDPKEQGY